MAGPPQRFAVEKRDLPLKKSVVRHSLYYSLFYLIAFLSNFYFNSIYPQQMGINPPNWNTFGGSWKFLTQINHDVQTWYHLFALGVQAYFMISFYEISQKKKKKSHGKVPYSNSLLYFQDRWFFLSATLSTIVGILFWGIFFIDRELILPKAAEKVYPPTLNLWQHGVVAILSWSEIGLVPRTSTSPTLDLLIVVLFAAFYIVFTTVAYLKLGQWQYPFLNQLGTTGFLAFYVFAVVLALASNVLVRFLCQSLFQRKVTRLNKKFAAVSQ
eukprot:TRINITY_DN4359_c0_g1_i2.p1 TRINITY_DN4359_c0_g1~~TRINITY_DN4359_c0_g1_i2.p1  ORF type:complete len:285 (+),score=73.06 TRINITY_DN4359_c0_g1_i2:48-857(+)